MRPSTRPPLVADPFYGRLKALVIERTGMAFYADRDDDLARVLGERLAATGIRDCASYLEALKDRAEMDELVAELTIGETYFFRYREQFEALRDIVLPEVIERNRRRRTIRIWSAGCATGPEPYTVAIILQQRFGNVIDGWDVRIVGTDINRKFLATAREGVYEEWALRATSDHIRASCFTKVGRKWRINEEFRRWVSFQQHNLVEEAFPAPARGLHSFDVILCRNVVIYFSTETFRGILHRFRESLVDDGWLVVGHSELNTELFRAFRAVEAPGAVLYRKSDGPAETVQDGPQQPLAFEPVPCLQEVLLATAPPEPEPPAFDPLPASPSPEPAEAITPAADPAAVIDDIRRLVDQGAWVEAMRRCRRLLADEPMSAAGHYYLGLVSEQLGEDGAAAEALRRAVYLDRGLPLPHYHLGLLAQKKGDRAGALRAFRNCRRVLDGRDAAAAVEHGDGLTVGELAELLRFQIEAMGGA